MYRASGLVCVDERKDCEGEDEDEEKVVKDVISSPGHAEGNTRALLALAGFLVPD